MTPDNFMALIYKQKNYIHVLLVQGKRRENYYQFVILFADTQKIMNQRTKPRLNRSTNKSSLSLKREFHRFTKQTLFTRI